MPSGTLLPAANDKEGIIEPAAIPAPAETRNERRLIMHAPLYVVMTRTPSWPRVRTPEYTALPAPPSSVPIRYFSSFKMDFSRLDSLSLLPRRRDTGPVPGVI